MQDQFSIHVTSSGKRVGGLPGRARSVPSSVARIDAPLPVHPTRGADGRPAWSSTTWSSARTAGREGARSLARRHAAQWGTGCTQRTSPCASRSLRGAAAASRAPPAPPGAPNVVLIVVDTLRADRLSQFGYERATSEALDLLAERASMFRSAYTPAPWTVPSVASILTGLLPARHRVDQTGSALADDFDVLPEVLARNGWQTVGFSFNKHVSRKAGFDQGFDAFRDVDTGRTGAYPDLGEMVDAALAWVGARSSDRPFFLYLQPMNIHGPYRVPEARRAALLGRPPRPGFEYKSALMDGIVRERNFELREQVTLVVLQSLNEQYDTAVRYTADELGRLLRGLDAAGLFDDALVVLTADHGEELFERGGFDHAYNLNAEVLHVPLWLKRPGQRVPQRLDEPVSLIDLLPTLLGLLGLGHDFDSAIDGRSLLPLLDGAPTPPAPRPVLAQAINPKRCSGRSFREGDWELIVIDESYDPEATGVRLYDLRSDPQQIVDLSRAEPERTKAMHARLEALYDSLPADAYRRVRYDIDAETRDSLEALGYGE